MCQRGLRHLDRLHVLHRAVVMVVSEVAPLVAEDELQCTCRRKNVNWLGEAPLQELARQIAHAHGPSGPNSEYLYRLAETTRKVWVPPCHSVTSPRLAQSAHVHVHMFNQLS